LRGADTIDDLEIILGLLENQPGRDTPNEAVAHVLQEVDDSMYSLTSWLAGLRVLQRWLAVRGQAASLVYQCGFLSCCAEFAERNPTRPSLAEVVEDMLDDHGFLPEPAD
jgi:hypothetical protein